eukprot:scaffold151087_cov30-Tisochrysis_lutea.AAC.1
MVSNSGRSPRVMRASGLLSRACRARRWRRHLCWQIDSADGATRRMLHTRDKAAIAQAVPTVKSGRGEHKVQTDWAFEGRFLFDTLAQAHEWQRLASSL